jgi:hypothetical protein
MVRERREEGRRSGEREREEEAQWRVVRGVRIDEESIFDRRKKRGESEETERERRGEKG